MTLYLYLIDQDFPTRIFHKHNYKIDNIYASPHACQGTLSGSFSSLNRIPSGTVLEAKQNALLLPEPSRDHPTERTQISATTPVEV